MTNDTNFKEHDLGPEDIEKLKKLQELRTLLHSRINEIKEEGPTTLEILKKEPKYVIVRDLLELQKNDKISAYPAFLNFIDKFLEKIPSPFQEKQHSGNIAIHENNLNQIKLNREENLIDQLNREGVNLKLINEKLMFDNLAIENPFKKSSQTIRIELDDKRFFILDIRKYAEDAFEHYQVKSNTQQNTSNSNQANDEFELRGLLALYAKEKFLEKYPDKSSNLLSENEKKEIVDWKKRGEIWDLKIDEFAQEFGFKELSSSKNNKDNPPSGPQQQNADEGTQDSYQKQPPSGPQANKPIKGILKNPAPNYPPEQLSGSKPAFQASNNKEQTVAEGPQKRENSPTNDTPYYLPTRLPKNQTGRFEEKTPNTPADLGGITAKRRVTWADKMEQVKFIPGRESTNNKPGNFSR